LIIDKQARPVKGPEVLDPFAASPVAGGARQVPDMMN
jgi:hypothetical protein